MEEQIASEYLESEEPQENAPKGYQAAYCFDLPPYSVTAEAGRYYQAALTVVQGDFFSLNPIPLTHGSYFWSSDTSADLAVIDEALAWQLFGSNDVSGMKIFLQGIPFVVSGVIGEEKPFSDPAVYGEEPRVYISADGYKKWLVPPEQKETELRFQTALFRLPDQTGQSAREWLAQQWEDSNKDVSIVEEGSRFSFVSTFEKIGNWRFQDAFPQALDLPYWESAARIAENERALLYLASAVVLLALFAAVCRLAATRQRREKRPPTRRRF